MNFGNDTILLETEISGHLVYGDAFNINSENTSKTSASEMHAHAR